jgi:aryl-alcohol dehydrogenase-like predicted oxidoreductase
MKIGLGTVEFAVKSGKHALRVQSEEVLNILDTAAALGISLLDTAAQAPGSEALLGECLQSRQAAIHPHQPQPNFRIVVRGPQLQADVVTALHAEQIEMALQQSLENLKQDHVYALLMNADDGIFLPGGERLYRKMESLREQAQVEKIGVSISDAAELEKVLANFRPDIVQLPLNILDQRLLQSGHIAHLNRIGIEIHARDIFLQGVLLDPTHLHPWFWPIRKRMQAYHDFLIAEGLTPVEGALSFVANLPEVDAALIGVHSASQLREVASGLDTGIDSNAFAAFACPEPKYLDPRLWNLYE